MAEGTRPFLYEILKSSCCQSLVSDILSSPPIAIMASLSRTDRPSQTWHALPGRDAHRRLYTLGLYWDKEAGAIICQYALQTKGERLLRHLGDEHNTRSTARRGLSTFVKHLSLRDPNQVNPQSDHSLPHPHLAIYSGGTLHFPFD